MKRCSYSRAPLLTALVAFFFLTGVSQAAIYLETDGTPVPYDPALKLWLDASDMATLFQDVQANTPVTADGQLVARWNDKSTGGFSVVEALAGDQPNYVASIGNLNAMPALHFDGGAGGDALVGPFNFTGIMGNADRTVISVWTNAQDTGQHYQHTFHMGNPATDQAYGHAVFRTEDGMISNHYWGSGFSTTASGLANPTVAVSMWDSSGNQDSWWVDGAPAGVDSRAALNTGASQLTVGSRLNPPNEGMRGDLAEVIVYNTLLTDAERNRLGGYLQTKYGITIAGADTTPGAAPPAPPAPPPAGPTVQNFDDPGTPYVSIQTDQPPGPTVIAGGPTGNFLRLVNDGVDNNKNAIAFDQTGDGVSPSGAVVMDFDVRITSNLDGNPADGAAFMLIPTKTYGTTGPGAYDGTWNAEEPNRPGVFAVGIDLHPAATVNDVSVHYNSSELANVTMDNADLDWDAGVFHHVHAELVEGLGLGGQVGARVTLTPDIHGTPGTPVEPFDVPFNVLTIPGLYSLYDYRVEFAARTGGLNFDFDTDNIRVATVDASTLAQLPTDVTQPGDTVVGFNAAGPGADWPSGEAPPNAIDDNTGTKYLNFGTTGNGGGSGTGGPTGFAVAPNKGLSVIQGLFFTSANDAPERDPVDYILEGSNDGGATFSEIARGSIPAFPGRFQQVRVEIDNDQRYGNYLLTFENVADPAAANSMQIAEVEFLSDDVLMDITQPGDAIVASSGNSPGAEGVANAIDDDPGTKYLNFDEQNTGFTVTPSMGATVVEGLGLRSANDAPERDPAEFILEGSNDGTNFDLIAQGTVPMFVSYDPTVPPAEFGRFSELNFGFDNDTPYLHYRLTFPDVQNPGIANSMQIGEVQLFGAPFTAQVVPEPSTWLLLGLGSLAMLLWRRRSRV